jgi:uncharacterized protein (DUF983 family)
MTAITWHNTDTNTVDIIASGYDWTCPNCDDWQSTIEVTDTVTCQECGNTYPVNDHHHAYK